MIVPTGSGSHLCNRKFTNAQKRDLIIKFSEYLNLEGVYLNNAVLSTGLVKLLKVKQSIPKP